MALHEYFENTTGTGVLSTANADGDVNSAVYSRPHVIDDNTVAFVMANRLSYANLNENPKAAYLFVEDGHGYQGKRLHLTRIHEDMDPEQVDKFRRRKSGELYERYKNLDASLVYFRVEAEWPLIGAEER